MRARTLSWAIGAAVFSLSGVALAAPAVDTLLTQGYDADNMALIFGISPIDQDDSLSITLDCGLEGTFNYELDTTDPDPDAKVTLSDVIKLTKNGNVVQFNDEDDVTADTAVPYGSVAAAECSLVSVDVRGPNGQVNHGQIVSSFVHALRMMDLDIRGKGCLVKLIAQSDYGKGDQKVTPSDASEVEPSSTGEVDLTSIATACAHGKQKSDDRPNGKPDHAGRPDHAGKPDHAGNRHND